MEPILIIRTEAALRRELDFQIKRDLVSAYSGYSKKIFYFLASTLVLIGLLLLTKSNSWVVLKVVLICLVALTWLIFLILFIIAFMDRYKKYRWREKTIKALMGKNEKTFITFDQEKIVFITEEIRNEVRWSYFMYYLESNDALFFLPGTNIYEASSISHSDIGEENFDKLREIVRSIFKVYDEEVKAYKA